MQGILSNYESLIKSLMAGVLGAGITFVEELTFFVRLLIAVATFIYVIWKFYTEFKKFNWRSKDRRDGVGRGYGKKDD